MVEQSKTTLNSFSESHYRSRGTSKKPFRFLLSATFGWHRQGWVDTWAGTGGLGQMQKAVHCCTPVYALLLSHYSICCSCSCSSTLKAGANPSTAKITKPHKHIERLWTAACRSVQISTFVTCVLGNYQQVVLIWSKYCSTDYRFLHS